MNFFKNLLVNMQIARAERELAALSDRALADIGIERSRISEVVRAAVAPVVRVANTNDTAVVAADKRAA